MPLGDRGQAAAVSARYRPAPGQPPECGAGLPDAVTGCDAARGVRVPGPALRRRDTRPVQPVRHVAPGACVWRRAPRADERYGPFVMRGLVPAPARQGATPPFHKPPFGAPGPWLLEKRAPLGGHAGEDAGNAALEQEAIGGGHGAPWDIAGNFRRGGEAGIGRSAISVSMSMPPGTRRRAAGDVRKAGRIQEDTGPRAGGCRRALATTPASRRQGFGRP